MKTNDLDQKRLESTDNDEVLSHRLEQMWLKQDEKCRIIIIRELAITRVL